MGNGVLRRYRAEPDVNYDHNAWRQPQPKAKKKGNAPTAKAKSVAPEIDHSNWRQPKQKEISISAETSTNAGIGQPAKVTFNQRSKAVASKIAPSVVPDDDDDDDDDDDLAGFSNLADAATKVWEELMVRRESTKDFNSLFHLGELKDGVERAAKRVDCLRREAGMAAATVDEKKVALDDQCAVMEERSLHVHCAPAHWKLGDIAIRRGKGLCELSTVHHEADPPYFEVRMFVSGSIAGTEATNLVPLAPPQRAILRGALRELEEAKATLVSAEEAVERSQVELKQLHQSLADQVEKKLKDTTVPASRPAGLATNSNHTVPQGLPDIDLVRKWTNAPPTDAIIKPELPSYPDMRGLREDVRTDSRTDSAATVPSPAINMGANIAQAATPLPTQDTTPRAPAGFPSFDELNKKAESQIPQEKQGAGANYPSAHPATSREGFMRSVPGDANDGTTPSYRRRSTSPRDKSPIGQRQRPERAYKEVPPGFPRFDTNDASSSVPQPNVDPQRKHQQPGPQGQAQPQMQPPMQPGSSPIVWVIYRAADGQPYYHNESTNETAWQLPPGARYREPTAQPASQQQQQQQQQYQQHQQMGQPEQEDPFAELRQREEQMRQQRENWAQWYTQYCNWYQQQGTNAMPQQGVPPASGNQGSQAPKFVPPKGPQPPKLDAGFEDHATYAIKSSVLREMEAMVVQDAPMAKRKKALRVLQMRWHPDKNPERLEVAKSVFQFIEETKPWFLHDPAENGAS